MSRAALLAVAILSSAATLSAAISGRVFDTSGAPLPKIRVVAYRQETPNGLLERMTSKQTSRPVLAEALSGDDGAFALGVSGFGEVELIINADGFFPFRAVQSITEPAGAIVLQRAEMRDVTITDNKRPVRGALVLLASDVLQWEAISGADGKVRVPEPRLWATWIGVAHPSYTLWRDSYRDSVALSGGTAISGKVVDKEGKGVAGARIVVDSIPLAVSGDEGAFAVAHAPRTWSTVEAWRGDEHGYASREAGSFVLMLRSSALITGIVRDQKQHPLTGVSLETGIEGNGTFVSVTDDRGAFVVRVPAGSKGKIEIQERSTFGGEATVAIHPGQTTKKDLVATAKQFIHGVVRTADGTPIAGALVRSAPDEQSPTAMTGAPAVLTGPDGRFRKRVSGSYADDEDLAVVAPGRPIVKMSIPAHTEKEIVFVVPDGVEIRGRVADGNGRAVAGANVTPAVDATAFVSFNPPWLPWATSDERGEFHGRIAAGGRALIVAHPGYLTARIRDLEVAEGMKPLAVKLDSEAVISGRITDSGGSPVSGMTLHLLNSLTEGASTGEDGTFEIDGVAPGTWTLGWGRYKMEGSRKVTAPATNVDIVVPKLAAVRGRVVDRSTSAPLTQFTVGYKKGDEEAGTAISSAEGTFVLSDVQPGSMTLTFYAEGYISDKRTVTADESTPPLEIALARGRTLSGRITGKGGKAVQGAQIAVEDEENAASDEEGRYEVKGIREGASTITVFADGYLNTERSLPATGDAVIDVELSPGLSLHGKVVDEEGKGIRDANISASSSAHGAPSQRAISSADGSFAMSGLLDAHYDVSASHSEHGGAELPDVDVSKAGELVLRLTKRATGHVSGTVTGGDPQALARQVVLRGDSTSLQQNFDASGRFRFEEVPAGAVTLQAMTTTMSSVRQTPVISVDVVAGAEAHAELSFAGATIRGRVLRAGEGVPLARVAFSGAREIRAMAVAGVQGEYEVSALPAGRYEVTVSGDGGLSFSTSYTVDGPGIFDIHVDTSQARAIVTDADTGLGLEGVTLSESSEDGGKGIQHLGVTDAAGNVRFDVQPGRPYFVVAVKDGYATVRGKLTDASQPLMMAMKRSEGATIRLVDARDGRTLTGYAIARDKAGSVLSSASSEPKEGLVTLNVLPGTYRFSGSANGYGSQTVTATVPSAPVVIPLRRGGKLLIKSPVELRGTAKLVQPDGEEYVRCWCNGVAAITLEGKTTLVDDIAPGGYTLSIELADGKKKTIPVTVVEGQTIGVSVEP